MSTSVTELWKYFFKNDTYYKTDRTHKAAWCKACINGHIQALVECDRARARSGQHSAVRAQDELHSTALASVDAVCGKAERMLTHIKKCKFTSADERTRILLSHRSTISPRVAPRSHQPSSPTTHPQPIILPSPSRHHSAQGVQPLKRAKSMHVTSRSMTSAGIHSLLNSSTPAELQQEFSADLCKLFIATNTPWVAAENPSLQQFVHKWVGSSVVVQDRRILSGAVLQKEVEKVGKRVEGSVKGRLATGQCDRWKNVAKSSVVSTMMTVENESYLIQTHDVTKEPKTGDQLLKHVLSDIKLMEEKYGVKVIAWCTDDGPDGKKMRRLLSNLFKYMVVTPCWAHQINLVVGDFLGLQAHIMEDVNHSLDVIKWFNNHGTALRLLKAEQELTYEGASWSLILPVITRWTAHYQAITRYLKLKRALKLCWARNEDELLMCAGAKQELREKACQIRDVVNDEELWLRLKDIQIILHPLAVAANVAQASYTRLDHVLLVLRNLIRIFTANTSYDTCLSERVVASLEKRWKKVDQDVFIASVFLNPFVRSSIFSKRSLSDANLYMIVERVYERVMQKAASLPFLRAFDDYRLKRGEFSDDMMGLDLMRQKFEAEDTGIDLRLVWSHLERDVDDGVNCLIRFAVHIFTIIINSGGCERVFSTFGITHTQRRNKLDASKVHNMAVVGMQIKRDNWDLGIARICKKRKFDEFLDSDSNSLSLTAAGSLEHIEPTDFCHYAEGLIHQAQESDIPSNEDDTDEVDDDLPTSIIPSEHEPVSGAPSSANSRPIVIGRNKKTQIPLSELFNYSLPADQGLELYWPASEQRLEDDLCS